VNIVETARLTLLEFADTDVDAIYEIQGDPQHMRFTFSAASREDSKNWLRRHARTRGVNGFAPWTIVHRADKRVIGWGGLDIDPLTPG
jgi:[ribosomal protein S5]-alanine N-acetyltransferase